MSPPSQPVSCSKTFSPFVKGLTRSGLKRSLSTSLCTSVYLTKAHPFLTLSSSLWGIGAIYAYSTYQAQDFLDDAIAIWQKYNDWVVSPSDAVNERHSLKNGTFPPSCNGGMSFEIFFSRVWDLNKLTLESESNAVAVFHVRYCCLGVWSIYWLYGISHQWIGDGQRDSLITTAGDIG